MWVVSNYDTMWALAIVLMLLLLFVAVIEYVANADGAGLIRLIWSDIPMAVLLTVFTLTLISTTLIVADELTAFVSAGNATQVSSYITTLESVMKKANQPSDIGDALLALFVGAAVAVGSGVMWVEMLLRSVGLGLVAIFLPLAWAGRVWPKTRRWAVRAGEVMLALILFKPVMVGVFYMGVAALANGTLPGVSNPGNGGQLSVLQRPGNAVRGRDADLPGGLLPDAADEPDPGRRDGRSQRDRGCRRSKGGEQSGVDGTQPLPARLPGGGQYRGGGGSPRDGAECEACSRP